MQTTTDMGHRAIGGGVVGLFGLFWAHLAQINLILQFVVLTLSLFGVLIGIVPKVRAWWGS